MKGPPITVKCDCETVERIPYGEAWTCPTCGRRWDTAQIPAEEYADLMRDMKRFRIEAMVVGVALGLGVFLIAMITERPIFPLGLLTVGGWWLLYMPRWRRRVRARARAVPIWKLRSG